MVTPRTDAPDPALLLRHAAFVRGLARKLAGDESTADDLVQDTWLAALHGKNVRSPRRWLAGVLGNLWRERVRGEERRRRREEQAARTETVSLDSEALDAAASGRDLVDLVLRLDEPFRSAVLLRYYENLPPRAIASRLGVPVKTVNSRLARGLAQLRESWKRRHGDDDRAWLAALVAIARPQIIVGPASKAAVGAATGAGSASALATGVLWMSAKTVLLCAALLGGAAWVILWNLPSYERAPISPDVVAAPSAATAESRPKAHSSEGAVDASAVVEPPRSPATAARAPESAPGETPPQRTIAGRVLDTLALPLAGVDVVLRSGGEVEGRGRSAAGGSFVIETPRAEGVVTADDPRFVTLFFGSVRESTAIEPLVVVTPFRHLAGRVVDVSGAALAGVRVSFAPPPGFASRFDIVFDATERTEWKASTDEHGRFELSRAPVIDGAGIEASLEGYALGRVDAPPTEHRSLEITLARPASTERALAGRVEDPAGKPVAGARVRLGSNVTLSAADGGFALSIAPGDRTSEIIAMQRGYQPGHVRASEDPATGAPQWPDFVVVRLGEPPLAISGRVVDEKGKPMAGMRIWIVEPTLFGRLDGMDSKVEFLLASHETPGSDAEIDDANLRTETTEADGRFRIEGLLPRAYSLRMMEPTTLRAFTAGPFEAGASDVRIVFERGDLHRIAGRIVTRGSNPVEGARVQLLGYVDHGVSDHGGERLTAADGRFAFEGIGTNALSLWIRGDAVVSVLHQIEDPAAASDLEIEVALRCNFKVDCGANQSLADAIQVLDDRGEAMLLQEVGPGGVYSNTSMELVEGRSKTLSVSSDARTLVLFKGDAEVRRLSLDLVPGRLTIVQP